MITSIIIAATISTPYLVALLTLVGGAFFSILGWILTKILQGREVQAATTAMLKEVVETLRKLNNEMDASAAHWSAEFQGFTSVLSKLEERTVDHDKRITRLDERVFSDRNS